MRVIPNNRRALWIGAAVLLLALLIPALARAQGSESAAGEAVAVSEGSPPAVKEAASVSEEAAASAKEAAPASEEPAPAAEETAPVGEEPPAQVQEAAPVSEEPAPAPKEAAPVVQVPVTEELANVVKEAAPVSGEATPVVKEAAPVSEEATPVPKPTTPSEEGKGEQSAGKTTDASTEASAENANGASQGILGAPRSAQEAPASLAPVEDPAAVGPAVASNVVAATPPSMPDQPSLIARPGETATFRAGAVSCELATVGIPERAECASDWLEASAGAASLASFDPAGAPQRSSASDPRPSPDEGGSPVQNRAPAPGPVPGPGGVGGGSAAGSGSGSASPASFTLVGIRLQRAPGATRQLQLRRLSWRASFFVLIPERPD